MKFINETELFEIGVGDIIVDEEGQYIIVTSVDGYKWVNLDNGYLSTTNYKSISELMVVFEKALVFKNDRFSLMLNKSE